MTDALDIEEIGVQKAGTADIDIVDENADRLVGRGRVEARIGDAADIVFVVQRGQRGEGQRGDAARQILIGLDIVVLQIFAGHGGDGDGGVLKAGFAALRGDHDFVQREA